jgi:hypothetical protein
MFFKNTANTMFLYLRWIVVSFLGLAVQSCIASQTPNSTQHILFVGDSFTHGRYLPVRTYNNTPGTGGLGSTVASTHVVDENFDTNVPARREDTAGETGPWGGIPGIFAELAGEAGLHYDVHIEAISATSLKENYAVASDVIDQPLWDAVVLQDASFEPIPPSLSGTSISDPQTFCKVVQTAEEGIHAERRDANVYLYSTWAPADTAYQLAIKSGSSFDTEYLKALATLTAAYHDAYVSAALRDGHIAAIAPVGDAWARAWVEGVANPDPYSGKAPGVALSFDYQPNSEPLTRDVPTDAGYHHPSIYGAYLNGLVLFQTITGYDVRLFGPREKAAAALGISGDIAIQLERVAWETVRQRNLQKIDTGADLCTQPGELPDEQ